MGLNPGQLSRPTELRTKRLVLRRWRDSDLDPFAKLNADPRVHEFMTIHPNREQSASFIERMEESFDTKGYGLWALELAETGEFIGYNGLVDVTYDVHFAPSIEIGWRMAWEAWGKGYATEAARASATYAFSEVGLDEVVAFCAVINQRSRNVMRRLGMVREVEDDFDYPLLPEGHPLKRMVLYRLRAENWVG